MAARYRLCRSGNFSQDMPFQPHVQVLPQAQQRLWPELAKLPKHFVLYGGTALALRLGHRSSVDFDFFTSEPFVSEDLLRSIEVLQGGKILQKRQPNVDPIG